MDVLAWLHYHASDWGNVRIDGWGELNGATRLDVSSISPKSFWCAALISKHACCASWARWRSQSASGPVERAGNRLLPFQKRPSIAQMRTIKPGPSRPRNGSPRQGSAAARYALSTSRFPGLHGLPWPFWKGQEHKTKDKTGRRCCLHGARDPGHCGSNH